MEKWLKKQSKVVQILLLVIPPINWVVELVMRWQQFLAKNTAPRLVLAILAWPLGAVLGWIDAVLLLLDGKLLSLD